MPMVELIDIRSMYVLCFSVFFCAPARRMKYISKLPENVVFVEGIMDGWDG